MFTELKTGLLILHGNRLEQLAQAVFAWLGANPLGALEEEVLLVQSNGMAEWLKMEIASAQGICAATRVELPARFIWRAYRAVLGAAEVPLVSALDKLPLTWRFMKLLPALAKQSGFEPVAGFLGDGDPARRLQLAKRLADLFDQYQVYRSDWLQDWAAGIDRIRAPGSGAARALPVPAEQRWQPALWRAALAELGQDQQSATRATLHQRFLETLTTSDAARRPMPGLARRVVLFGTTHIPHQSLEAIAALASRCQVLMAVPNPCRFHWADIVDGRELLRAARRRQALRAGRDLARVPLQDMHAHGHPLLAAWGRQSRDFVRQLDAFDDVELARTRFAPPRVDLFDEGEGVTLLAQVQARIRDLVPLSEHLRTDVTDADRSIVFHSAHSAQREIEILHDQLLHLFAHPPEGQPLNPRDVVVMVPDIDVFAPAIRSVFGQHARGSARHIPWGIADQKDRGHKPLLVALEWLLRAPQQRFGASEVRDLLDVPAVARRFGLEAEDLPTLVNWIEGAGIRWGLGLEQRESLDLGACGEQNSWSFGLRRMLLGYATGELAVASGFAGIEPYAEVAGLSAGLAGTLADLVDELEVWWREAAAPRAPEQWGERLRSLLETLFDATDDMERALLAALDDALTAWLQACESAGFDALVDLAVVREAWLDGVDAPGVSRRFRAGGVTFCTLLPLRAIPFQVVCLLGMNDGDYPRRSTRSDFDLMGLPGQVRPGDRSRRDDDRQLMLDAVLSARRVLYLSWIGRSQRDNQQQPPSVLVAQLRDYLAAGWGRDVVAQRTTEHPLQPFSRKYFEPKAAGEAGAGLFTYADEWRAAHVEPLVVHGPEWTPAEALRPDAEPMADRPRLDGAPDTTLLTIAGIASFLRNPVKEFFRHRLQVAFDTQDAAAQDDEAFTSAGLERWTLLDEALRGSRRQLEQTRRASDATCDANRVVQAQVARLMRAGRLPMAGPGRQVEDELVLTLVPMVSAWLAFLDRCPEPCDKRPLHFAHPEHPDLMFNDWLVGLWSPGGATDSATWIDLQASKIADKKMEAVRADKLLSAWIRCLASAACGQAADGVLIGADAVVQVKAPSQEEASATLADLMLACRDGLSGNAPLPTALLTGLAVLEDPSKARQAYEGSDFGGYSGEGNEACLARLFPDFATLSAQANFEAATLRLYAPYKAWLDQHVDIVALPDSSGLGTDDA
ncbi:MAG: exodeoxyribonuclease V subunit gamma [Burkholderiaceae bacterium]